MYAMQFSSAFGKEGLRSARQPFSPFCDPERMRDIQTPVFMMCGDRDKMCPPQASHNSLLGKLLYLQGAEPALYS